MTRTLVIAAVVLALAAGTGPHLAAQRSTAPPPDRTSLLALVRAGKTAEAWRAWDALPDGAPKHRLGVELAVEAKDMARGVAEYDALTAFGKTPDQPALKMLALGQATILSASPDRDVRVEACGPALVLDPMHAACRKMLEELASRGPDVSDQGLGVYALANAGLRPFPGLFGTLELTMDRSTKQRIAQSMTRLPSADRLALVRALLEDRDMGVQYQTLLILADVPGDEVASAVRGMPATGPATLARTIALARHGDAASLATVDQMLPNLSGFIKIQAATALADALNAHGEPALEEMLHSPVDLERIEAAQELGHIIPDTAFRTLLDSLGDRGSPAVRTSALFAAGTIRMGTDRSVYRRLAGEPPDISAMAIRAIADTLVPIPVARRTPPRP